MSQIKTLNGVQYTLPQYNDTGWGANTGNVLTQYMAAIADVTLQLSGGSFTLTADVNFGATYGLVSTYFTSRTANAATAGAVRLAKTDVVSWRNNANGANIDLSKDTSDNLKWNATKILLSGAVVNADVASAAGIALNKLAAITASTVPVGDASGFLVSSAVTATELGYVSGVSSAIQTQINTKATGTLASGGANRLAYYTGATALAAATAITASRALASDANGIPVATAVTATELGYVSGVTSSIQTQLSSALTNPMTANLVFSPTTKGIKGTTTNDSADALNVGEYVVSNVGAVAMPASGVVGDLTSISLTAGDWDVSGVMVTQSNSGTWSEVYMGISTTSGNSSTGLTLGQTYIGTIFSSTSVNPLRVALTLPAVRMSLSATTTVYLKMLCQKTGGTPTTDGGRLSARRVR